MTRRKQLETGITSNSKVAAGFPDELAPANQQLVHFSQHDDNSSPNDIPRSDKPESASGNKAEKEGDNNEINQLGLSNSERIVGGNNNTTQFGFDNQSTTIGRGNRTRQFQTRDRREIMQLYLSLLGNDKP
ncbi:hypothetical protein Asppvi_006006 [Aspergillus pseudoviridinutans]|uniref:Uncharacterized protein n=1 Tax=Aspergillus pseudoviridinutans TaxID=1517512 RepID=A0A9P3BDD8_9EURO|nr:uncharacterized protein Asppvi_006006 [Aspergillus pseudoviridinutans]GIJ87103.1 hypothetical protein Asppvi_006006 [Aspergillus pseudoviridinutans]